MRGRIRKLLENARTCLLTRAAQKRRFLVA